MKRFPYSILLCLLFTTCRSELDQIVHSETYSLSSFYNTSKVRLFTRQVELTNQELIRNFVNRHGVNRSFKYLNLTDTLRKLSGETKVKFLTKEKAQLEEVPSSYVRDYTVKKSDKYIYFIGDEQGGGAISVDEFKRSNLIAEIQKHQPFSLRTEQAPLPQGIGYRFFTRTGHVFYTSGRDLIAARLHFFLTTPGYSIAMSLSDEFESNSYTKLGSSDTLAVQEYALKFVP